MINPVTEKAKITKGNPTPIANAVHNDKVDIPTKETPFDRTKLTPLFLAGYLDDLQLLLALFSWVIVI